MEIKYSPSILEFKCSPVAYAPPIGTELTTMQSLLWVRIMRRLDRDIALAAQNANGRGNATLFYWSKSGDSFVVDVDIAEMRATSARVCAEQPTPFVAKMIIADDEMPPPTIPLRRTPPHLAEPDAEPPATRRPWKPRAVREYGDFDFSTIGELD